MGKPTMADIASRAVKTESEIPVRPWLDTGKEFVEKNCRLLYPDHIGWAAGRGWYGILKDLSVELETLNLVYGKYGIRITADQVKEKFGGLRFYYSTGIIPPWYYTAFGEFFDGIADFIDKRVFFDYESVEVIPTHHHHYINVFGKTDVPKTNLNVDKTIKLDNGNTMLLSHSTCYRKMRRVPRRNRLMYAVAVACRYLGRKLIFRYRFSPSRRQDVICEFVEGKVQKLVAEAENKSYLTCEECGEELKKGSVCSTEGWIKTLCRSCADKTGNVYILGKKRYRNGKELKEETDGTEA